MQPGNWQGGKVRTLVYERDIVHSPGILRTPGEKERWPSAPREVLRVFPSSNPCPYEFGSDTIPSDCFERLCTEKAEKPDGEFFSIVSREICGLKVIMSAEVDCSSSMILINPPVNYNLLTLVY